MYCKDVSSGALLRLLKSVVPAEVAFREHVEADAEVTEQLNFRKFQSMVDQLWSEDGLTTEKNGFSVDCPAYELETFALRILKRCLRRGCRTNDLIVGTVAL